MVEQQMCRPQAKGGRRYIRRRHRKSPGGREFGSEENSAVEFDSAQDFRERIHYVLLSVLCTICKVPWPLSKGISLRKPLGQVMATLGHGRTRRSTAQL